MKPSTRAFTLLELIMVIAIVGLTTTVAVAAGAVSHHRSDPVLAGLLAARDSAVREGRGVVWLHHHVAVRFSPDGSSSGGIIDVSGRRYGVSVTGGRVVSR